MQMTQLRVRVRVRVRFRVRVRVSTVLPLFRSPDKEQEEK